MRTTAPSRLFAALASLLAVLGVLLALLAPTHAQAAPSSSPSPSATSTTGAATDKPVDPKNPRLQTYGIGPANAEGILDRRGAFVYAGRPGTVVRDQVALVNYTLRPREAKVYASDAFTTEGGSYDLLAGGKKSTDVGSWIDLTPRTVTIPPKKKATQVQPGTLIVPFTLTVPSDATPGDHGGGIVLSIRTKGAEGTNAVVVDRRVGTRVFMRVAGPLEPALAVTDLKVTYDGTLNPIGKGTARVSYTVRNTGNVVLSARQSTKVAGLLGLGTATPAASQADLVQLLPEAAVKVSVDVPGVWPTFRPSATVTLVPYQGTAEAPIDLAPVSASTAFWAVPWTLLAIIAALILAFLAWQLLRRRGRNRPKGAHSAHNRGPAGPGPHPETESELVSSP